MAAPLRAPLPRSSPQVLLSSDHVSYKIRPIAGYSDLVDANLELIVKSDTVRVWVCVRGLVCMRAFVSSVV